MLMFDQIVFDLLRKHNGGIKTMDMVKYIHVVSGCVNIDKLRVFLVFDTSTSSCYYMLIETKMYLNLSIQTPKDS